MTDRKEITLSKEDAEAFASLVSEQQAIDMAANQLMEKAKIMNQKVSERLKDTWVRMAKVHNLDLSKQDWNFDAMTGKLILRAERYV